MSPTDPLRITLIGAGTIGLSFAALHLKNSRHPAGCSLCLTIYDSSPDIEEYVLKTLPTYVDGSYTRSWSSDVSTAYSVGLKNHDLPNYTAPYHELIISKDLENAISTADIIQEQGPENVDFKTELWSKVERHCPPDALLWSSSSGIPASIQSTHMKDRSRLIVVHPFNPPHIMPLLELVPSQYTNASAVSRSMAFWKSVGRTPIVLRKETTGFVANRLAFALLRESIHLVNEGVISVKDLDDLVTSSMGPRWAIAGPFKSYHAGGGLGGLEGFFRNIGATIQGCWDDVGAINVGEGWEQEIFRQTKEAYSVVDMGDRDKKTRNVLDAIQSEGKSD